MAIDNLNYYSNWLPAWQQTDKYSSQPWCLRSKNLDIFSSSKSVKGTAWSTPSQWANDIIKQEWKLKLKTDGKVYEEVGGVDVLLNDPSINFPIYQVCYTWKNWTYTNAQWGTAQDMSVRYEWDEWRSYVVFTDRAALVYTKTAITLEKEFVDVTNWTTSSVVYENGYKFTRDTLSQWDNRVTIKLTNPRIWSFPIKIYCDEPDTTDMTLSLSTIEVDTYCSKYYYDAQVDGMVGTWWGSQSISVSWDIHNGITLTLPAWDPEEEYTYNRVFLEFRGTRRTGKTWNSRSGAALYIDMNWWPNPDHKMTINWVKSEWDMKELYSYLPLRERKLVSVWDYAYSQSYWMKWVSFQPLYKWNGTWVDDNWTKRILYDFISDMWWESDPAMDVIGMMIWNEQVYMIWNLNWDWYIIPCDLSWGRWTPYIAYWCTFKWVTNIDYLMYLVGEDRGISQLWVYNNQELVPLIWWNKESNLVDYVDTAEQYKFDWKMLEYRWDLILTTTDNRVFQYWQTYWGKGWTFIHEVPWTITELKTDGKDLVIKYTSWANNYSIIYQDDIISKNYNTEWEAEYPIQIWNHLLEKEESDLYASYILPNSNCKLEFWGMANHYHFWTFKSSDSYTFSTTASYKMKGCTWNYVLKFIEKNDNRYTFRLEGDLPLQTVSGMKITDTEWTELITYSEYNHFRKIWEITTDGYSEWEFRFHNLNNKLELPKSHSLQIMVRGKGTANYTPELFALDLVANQRDRW